MHPDRKVLALDLAGQDLGDVRLILAADILTAGAFCRAAAARGTDGSAVHIHQLRIVHVATERALYGFRIPA